jgi:hypothetical protein
MYKHIGTPALTASAVFKTGGLSYPYSFKFYSTP